MAHRIDLRPFFEAMNLLSSDNRQKAKIMADHIAECAAREVREQQRKRPFMCCEHDEECERQGVPCSNHVSNDPPKQDVVRVVAVIRPNTGEFAIRRAYEGEEGYAEMLLEEFKEYEEHKEKDATWFSFCVDLVAEQHNRGTKR